MRMEKEKAICPHDKNCNENILLLFKISLMRENMLLYRDHEGFDSCLHIIHLKKFCMMN